MGDNMTYGQRETDLLMRDELPPIGIAAGCRVAGKAATPHASIRADMEVSELHLRDQFRAMHRPGFAAENASGSHA